MEFVEAPTFTRLITDLLDDSDYTKLQVELAKKPDLGKVIPGSGGVRKVRWAGSERGKRGGLRAIYYCRSQTIKSGCYWRIRRTKKIICRGMKLNN